MSQTLGDLVACWLCDLLTAEQWAAIPDGALDRFIDRVNTAPGLSEAYRTSLITSLKLEDEIDQRIRQAMGFKGSIPPVLMPLRHSSPEFIAPCLRLFRVNAKLDDQPRPYHYVVAESAEQAVAIAGRSMQHEMDQLSAVEVPTNAPTRIDTVYPEGW